MDVNFTGYNIFASLLKWIREILTQLSPEVYIKTDDNFRPAIYIEVVMISTILRQGCYFVMSGKVIIFKR